MKFLSKTTATAASNGKKVTECPYAVALEETASVTSNSQEDTNATGTTHHLIEESIKQCPAFASSKTDSSAPAATCPFQGKTSEDDIKATFLRIPPSHYQMKAFTAVLAKLHDHTDDMSSDSHFHIPGGCPVPAEIKHHMSFRRAMEDLSLAAIMGRMVESFEKTTTGDSKDSTVIDSDNQEEDRSTPYAHDEGKDTPATAEPTLNEVAPTPKNDKHQHGSTNEHRQSLSESLKSGTAVSHQAAEDVHFVRNFIRGEIDRGLYSKLIVALYHVYVKLEVLLDQYGPNHFGSCHFPESLRRTEALQEDMDFWNGTLDVPPSPATVDYLNRLDEIAATDPLLLLAHAYTRYLGDLSGGKVLSRVAGRALHLDRHTMEGLAFYQFDKIPSAKKFKDMYREALDNLPLTAAQIEGLVAEANVAFCLNMRLFEELDVDGNLPGAKVRPLSEALAYADPALWKQKQAEQKNGTEEECPFLVQSKQSGSGGKSPKTSNRGRCPWPFVLAHDPIQFMNDWQTWVLIGVILCVVWSQLNKAAIL